MNMASVALSSGYTFAMVERGEEAVTIVCHELSATPPR